MPNHVVARYIDGRMVKGTSLDVAQDRPKFHVREDDGTMTQVLLTELKALFFVKSLDGNSEHVEGQEIDAVDPRLRGSRVLEVTFQDGEKIVGLCTRYPPKGASFFLVPVDSDSNNLRILVNSAALQGMALVEETND